MSATRSCRCCDRPMRASDVRLADAPGTVAHAGHEKCGYCNTHDGDCDVEVIQLCRYVPDGDGWRPELVSGVRRGRRDRGPWQVKVDGVIREYPRDVWMKVEA